MLSRYADCAIDLEQVDFVLFKRDEKNNLVSAIIHFRNGSQFRLETSSTVALAERFDVSASKETLTIGKTNQGENKKICQENELSNN